MKKIIITVLVIGLSIFLSSAAFAEGEKDLSKNSQTNIKVCLQKITLLEKKIKNLGAALQNKTVVRFVQKNTNDSSKKWFDCEPNDYDSAFNPSDCDF